MSSDSQDNIVVGSIFASLFLFCVLRCYYEEYKIRKLEQQHIFSVQQEVSVVTPSISDVTTVPSPINSIVIHLAQ